mmetsp:Transcript_96754/g.216621  ORF Transcript_96754/g.216621 Transcript_96754/m.216621 type:complete len:130 (+) Transcript_96754:64-453(+)
MMGSARVLLHRALRVTSLRQLGGDSRGTTGLQWRPFTNWWQRSVDGVNPDNPNYAAVAAFLRAEGIDPYRLPRDELDEFRKNFLTQLRWFAKAEAEEEKLSEACKLLQEKRAPLLARWRGLYALPGAAN